MVLEDITIVYVFFWVLKVFWVVLSKVEIRLRLG